MSIYSRKGDKGKTDIFNPLTEKIKRVSKNNSRLEVIGTIDELNSCLGVVKSFLKRKKDVLFIEEVQKNLFLINSIIAGKKLKFSKSETKNLEEKIDFWESKISKLEKFILPGGSQTASFIHLARSITRRVERRLVVLSKVNPSIFTYLNRLSDALFVFARYQNVVSSKKEVFWK